MIFPTFKIIITLAYSKLALIPDEAILNDKIKLQHISTQATLHSSRLSIDLGIPGNSILYVISYFCLLQ